MSKLDGEMAIIGPAVSVGLIWLVCMAAWGTHVIVCIKTDQIAFLIAGAIAFPVAIIHGIGIWMGVW